MRAVLNEILSKQNAHYEYVSSLERLADHAAPQDTGGAAAAQFLLCLYNGPEYPMDLTELKWSRETEPED